MLDFYRTQAGRHFFDRQLPQLIDTLGRIAKVLEHLSDRADKEAGQESDENDRITPLETPLPRRARKTNE